MARKHVLLSALIIGAIVSPTCVFGQQAAGTAEVSGHVLDWRGRPVEGAVVTFFPLEAAISGIKRQAISNREGAYHMVVPALGPEKFYAKKEADNYPNTELALFAPKDLAVPQIAVVPGGAYDNVDIHLGRPGGRIEIDAVDSATGLPLKGARIVLRLKEDPTIFFSSSVPWNGPFSTILPERPITLRVTASGHVPWDYSDTNTGHDFIEIAPFERLSIKAVLVPLPK